MSAKLKLTLVRICAAAALLITAALLPTGGVLRLLCFLVPYALVGWDVYAKAARNLCHGQIFDENFLMVIATVGALALGEYPEAVFVMLFYQLGEWFQKLAVGKSRRSIAELMAIRPDSAAVLRQGETVIVSPEEVAVGETIVVQPGEKIPLDGVVAEGASTLSTAALTGEAKPVEVGPGDEALSGCVNLSGLLKITVSRPFGESTVVKILELVENAAAGKAKTEQFITRFARVYTPVVVGGALLVALLPPLFAGHFTRWLHRALIFLVVSCPCALVLSVPLTFFGGIGGASKRGILVKGAHYMEALARAKTAVFDKTGTLTEGRFTVQSAAPAPGCPLSEQQLLALAAAAEQFSTHPLAASLCAAAPAPLPGPVENVQETAGEGVCATVAGRPVAVGGRRLMERLHIPLPQTEGEPAATEVHLAVEGRYCGSVRFADRLKAESPAAVLQLRALGVEKIVVLTGDRPEAAEAVCAPLGVDEVYAGLLPGDKVARVNALKQHGKKGDTLLFAGDGMNDAPVLARADVGIAMGAMGSDAAIEAADVVLMDDNPEKVAEAIALSRRTLAIVRQNIGFSLAVKGLVLALSVFGLTGMWQAVFADVGVMVLAVLNASRALAAPRREKGQAETLST